MPKKRCVPERRNAAIAEQQVERHGEQAPDHDLAVEDKFVPGMKNTASKGRPRTGFHPASQRASDAKYFRSGPYVACTDGSRVDGHA